MEHKAVRLTLECRGRRHIAVYIHAAVEGTDLAPLKVSARTAKYKIDVAGDKATAIVLPAHNARSKLLGPNEPARLHLARRQRAHEQRVLMSQNAAGINNQPVAIGIQGERLSHLAAIAGIVFNR